MVAAAAAVLAGSLAFAAKKSAAKAKTVYVGVAIDTTVGYLDDKGNYAGYEAEMLRAIDEMLPQYEFKYEYSDLSGILLALSQGRYDIGLKQ